jgi:hypothetical protein
LAGSVGFGAVLNTGLGVDEYEAHSGNGRTGRIGDRAAQSRSGFLSNAKRCTEKYKRE